MPNDTTVQKRVMFCVECAKQIALAPSPPPLTPAAAELFESTNDTVAPVGCAARVLFLVTAGLTARCVVWNVGEAQTIVVHDVADAEMEMRRTEVDAVVLDAEEDGVHQLVIAVSALPRPPVIVAAGYLDPTPFIGVTIVSCAEMFPENAIACALRAEQKLAAASDRRAAWHHTYDSI